MLHFDEDGNFIEIEPEMASDIETESARFVAACTGFLGTGEQFTDRCEQLFVNFLGSVPAPTHFQQDPPPIIFRSTIGPGVTTDISTRS